jgi:hypothetical protein
MMEKEKSTRLSGASRFWLASRKSAQVSSLRIFGARKELVETTDDLLRQHRVELLLCAHTRLRRQ